MFPTLRLPILFAILFTSATTAFACAYNVRDVGFVELTTDPYQLYGFVDENVSEGMAGNFSRLVYTSLLNTNLEVKMINVSDTTDEAALKHIETLGVAAFPALVLVSPEGRAYKMPLDVSAEGFEDHLRQRLDRLVMSPVRAEILDQCVSRYGVVLVVEGSDNGSNLKAMDAAEDAVTKIHARMEMLPKPIAEPPVTLVINATRAREEPLLMWALDLAEYAGENPPADAAAVVLYGRVRRMGPNLRAKELSAEFLTKFLSVVGADCECGLDRSWMQGTMLPIRWDRDIQKRVASMLGFDPEDPMMKTEISITISKGSRTGSGTKTGAPESDFSFGYQEISTADARMEGELAEVSDVMPEHETSAVKAAAALALADDKTPEPPQSAVNEPVAIYAINSDVWLPIGGLVIVVGLAALFILLRKGENS